MSKPSITAASGVSALKLKLEIVIHDEAWPVSMTDEARYREIAAAIAKFIAFDSLERAVVALSSDIEVQALNARYRGKDRPTNVLSFPAVSSAVGGFEPGEAPLLGDIILARETVVREAAEQGISFERHATHLIVHGILHLLGYDHQDEAAAEEMESLEIVILSEFGIANPYTEELDDAV